MDPLPLAVCLLWSYRTRDFHPLDYTHAGRTPLWCLTAPPSPRCEACHTILRSLTLPYESCSLATPLNGGTIKLIAAGRCLNPHAKGLSNLRTFSTTLLHNLPAPAGHNLRRSRAPFPFEPFEPFEPAHHWRAEPSAPGPRSGPNKKALSFESAFY